MLPILLMMIQLWTPSNKANDPRVLLDGSWQSCKGEDGQYEERIFEHRVNGKFLYELHLGPYQEFGIYTSMVDGDHSHADSTNLLTPYQLSSDTTTKQVWSVPALHVKFTATLAGGSRDDCESFYITLESMK